MNKNEFKEIFCECFSRSKVNINDIVFFLHPVEEKKNYNSTDDMFRLTFMQSDGFAKKTFRLDQVIDLFTWMAGKYPMWIDIFIEKDDLVHLYFSRRFRKYSEVSMCSDRDVPPFRIIKDADAHRQG